jgi:UDP-N-acetylglucosamine 2-epimerase
LLHRTELIENKDNFETILKSLNSHAEKGNQLVFTMHTTTAEKIKSYGFDKYFTHKNIRTIPKQPYFDFMAIVKAADYAVTDGGGLQEDAYFLGIPVLVHRERTERQEGIGVNATLSRLDIAVVRDFLDHHINKADLKKLTNATDPSKIVIDYLRRNHFV